MKKLLLGSIALTLFSVSILLFQISCKKEVTAQQPTGAGGVNQLGLIVFTKYFMRPVGTPQKQREIWIANIDGTNPRKVPVNIPSDVGNIEDIKLSPNGQTIFFTAELKSNYRHLYIYSCSVDGTSIKRIVDFDKEFIDDTNYTRPGLESVN